MSDAKKPDYSILVDLLDPPIANKLTEGVRIGFLLSMGLNDHEKREIRRDLSWARRALGAVPSKALTRGADKRRLAKILCSQIGFLLAPSIFIKAFHLAYRTPAMSEQMSYTLRGFLGMNPSMASSLREPLIKQLRSSNLLVASNALASLHHLNELSSWQLHLIFRMLRLRGDYDRYKRLDASYSLQEILKRKTRLSLTVRKYLSKASTLKWLAGLTVEPSMGPNILLAMKYLKSKHGIPIPNMKAVEDLRRSAVQRLIRRREARKT